MSVVVKAVQELDRRVTDFASTTLANVSTGTNAAVSTVTEWVGEKVTATFGYFREIVADLITAKKVKVEQGIELKDRATGDTYCITLEYGDFMKEKGDCPPLGSSTPKLEEPNSSPVITINGNNPAEIEVGTAYSDLGVIARDSEGRDLSIRNFVNGVQVEQISLDTSTSTTYTIDYAATDTDGNTATSTRTVIVGNQQPTTDDPQQKDEETPATDPNESTSGEPEQTATTTPPAEEPAIEPSPAASDATATTE